MADEADRADAVIELNLAEALSRSRGVEILPRGYCHNCEADLPDDSLFCDKHCREDWEARRAHKRATEAR